MCHHRSCRCCRSGSRLELCSSGVPACGGVQCTVAALTPCFALLAARLLSSQLCAVGGKGGSEEPRSTVTGADSPRRKDPAGGRRMQAVPALMICAVTAWCSLCDAFPSSPCLFSLLSCHKRRPLHATHCMQPLQICLGLTDPRLSHLIGLTTIPATACANNCPTDFCSSSTLFEPHASLASPAACQECRATPSRCEAFLASRADATGCSATSRSSQCSLTHHACLVMLKNQEA